MRKIITRYNYLKLILVSAVVALLAVLLADSLKLVTGYYEDRMMNHASHFPGLFILLPTIGITTIYFLRKYAFKGYQNKGIKEIYHTLEHRRVELPLFKIPSHYFNGFLTVIFGGSTGVEVSTVVATAALGAASHKRKMIANKYKTELIAAGAGIAALFSSPLTGFLFAVEVIARKLNKTIFISCATASMVAWLFMLFMGSDMLFHFTITKWQWQAIPFIGVLSLLAGLAAGYFTRVVIYTKERFGRISNNFVRVNLGAVTVGLCICFLPALYGDSYHSIPGFLSQISQHAFSFSLTFTLLAIVLIKPVVASLTLGAGGDGGVFAPSIVAGAALGMLVAIVCNRYLGTHLIVFNFVLIGAAAMLSAAIHAPLTAIFLAFSLAPGGYILFVPLAIACYTARYASTIVCDYTVYSYKGQKMLAPMASSKA